MSACAGMEGLLAERASGPIAPEEEARLAGHLASCAGCAEVFAEYRRLFGAVAVEPQRGASIAPATVRAFRRRRQRRVTGIALGAGFGAAAAAAALVLAPAFHASRAPQPAALAASWEPDVDAALSAGAGDDAAASASDADGDDGLSAADVALAAYDDATSG